MASATGGRSDPRGGLAPATDGALAAGHGGPTQRRVRQALMQVGGYWRPLAGLARVLEELGEIAETLAGPSPHTGQLAEELADLWIITTALADQFLGEVAEPDVPAAGAPLGPLAGGEPLGPLLVAAGRVARIVNYYDGPKTPREPGALGSLNEQIAQLHRFLAALADAHGVDLAGAVEHKLAAIPRRDRGRFARRGEDPSTAPALDDLRPHALALAAHGLDPAGARLWGAPACSWNPTDRELDALAAVLASFAKAAIPERLHACVLSVPPAPADAAPPRASRSSGSEPARAWRERLLTAMSARGLEPHRLRLAVEPVAQVSAQGASGEGAGAAFLLFLAPRRSRSV